MFTRNLLSAALCGLVLPYTAMAQTSLGFTGGELALGTVSFDGTEHGFVEGWADVAITAAHGIQIDFALQEHPQGMLGTVAAHLYMTPHEGQKYGVFATVSDLDGEGFTAATVGLEGLFALTDTTAVGVHGGIGLADRISGADGFDFVFAGGSLTHELSPSVSLAFVAEVAEYDETDFRATGYTAMIEAEYRPNAGPIALKAGFGVSGLEGRDGRPAETVARLGLSWRFGATASPARGAFRRPDAYAPLALRGLF